MNHFEKFNQWILEHQSKGMIQIEHQNGQFEMTGVSQNGVPVGVNVTNLDTKSFLPISVFHTALFLLQTKGGKALKGVAMIAKLGEEDLPFDSVEGYVAKVVYVKSEGDSVFRRITPISRILEEAGVCKSKHDKYLYLV